MNLYSSAHLHLSFNDLINFHRPEFHRPEYFYSLDEVTIESVSQWYLVLKVVSIDINMNN